jgi:hypothetical protein
MVRNEDYLVSHVLAMGYFAPRAVKRKERTKEGLIVGGSIKQ